MKEFDRFMDVMRKVKTECPWDKKQTHQTLRQYFIEETYEVIDTIDEMNYTDMQEELGDVLTQIAFHSLLAEDKDKFGIEDVCNTVSEKLIRRHPHIFGDVKVKDEHEVMKNWESIKLDEGKKESVLDGVPKHLPAL
ncbi:MAG: MazG family protein, partial [bacterium]|nr:MazG family protein [bacterium]